MTDELDDMLRRLAESTSATVTPMPVTEVRRRGGARRTRRVVALTIVAAVTVAGLGTVALRAGGAPTQDQVALPSATTRTAQPGDQESVDRPTTTSFVPSGPVVTITETPPALGNPPTVQLPPAVNTPTSFPPVPGSTGIPVSNVIDDPRGPGRGQPSATPAPGRSADQVLAQSLLLTNGELPRDGFGTWKDSKQTFALNCAPLIVEGFESTLRVDTYAFDGGAGEAWQEMLLPGTTDDAVALYRARLGTAKSCSPSNVVTITALPGVDQGELIAYSTACRIGAQYCGTTAFVVAVAQVRGVVVYVQLSQQDDFGVAAARSAVLTALTRVRDSSLGR